MRLTMASPPIVMKGVSKWSLNPDDNATADDRINWQEGQMPSSVNNSARAMMMRIREQHDLNQAQFKSILDTVGGRFGTQIKAITADTYTITATSTPNNWNLEFHFNDKLTLEEYNAYKAGNLYLLTTLKATDLVNNSLYKQFSYNSVIYINLYFNIGSVAHEHIMMFKLNFFGIEKKNQAISFHELKEFVNCSTLQVGYDNTSTNFVALPMKRTYIGNKTMTPTSGSRNIDTTKTSNLEWYYISPTQCICTHSLDYKGANDREFAMAQFLLGTSISIIELKANPFWASNLAFFVLTADSSGQIKVDYQSNALAKADSNSGTDWIFSHIHGSVTFMITGTPTQLKDYPMILEPTATNPYPIIV